MKYLGISNAMKNLIRIKEQRIDNIHCSAHGESYKNYDKQYIRDKALYLLVKNY